MKKILSALAVFAVLFALFSTAPANAAETKVTVVPVVKATAVSTKTLGHVRVNKRNCTSYVKSWYGSVRYWSYNQGERHIVSRSGGDQVTDFGLRVWYMSCPGFAQVTDQVFQVNPTPNRCNAIQNFQMNPNNLGNWNAINQVFNCDGRDSYSRARANPYNDYIFPSDPGSERCVTAAIKIAIAGRGDENLNSGTICVI